MSAESPADPIAAQVAPLTDAEQKELASLFDALLLPDFTQREREIARAVACATLAHARAAHADAQQQLEAQLAEAERQREEAERQVESARDLIRADDDFQTWAQSYLDAGRWAGHDRSDAIKTELLERDKQLAEAERGTAALRQLVEEWRENHHRAMANAENLRVMPEDRRQCYGVAQAYDQCAVELEAALSLPASSAAQEPTKPAAPSVDIFRKRWW